MEAWHWVFWIGVSYLSGSILFARVFVSLLVSRSIDKVGDGNPGTVNAFKALGYKRGILVMLLEFGKGFAPLFLATTFFGASEWLACFMGMAAICGHAFPLFFRFQGGKAVAVTFGAWSGITRWEAPTVLGIAMTIQLFVRLRDAYKTFVAMGFLLVYLLLFRWGSVPLFVLWAFNLGLLVFKHRKELG